MHGADGRSSLDIPQAPLRCPGAALFSYGSQTVLSTIGGDSKGSIEMEYNKIVRDKIPDIIMAEGGTCKTKTVSDEQAVLYLIDKVNEELEEFKESGKPEEIADIFEALGFIVVKMGFSMEDIERLRHEKFEKRGGFTENIILLESSKQRSPRER